MEKEPRTSKFNEFLDKRPYAEDAFLILGCIVATLLAAGLGWLVGSGLGAIFSVAAVGIFSLVRGGQPEVGALDYNDAWGQLGPLLQQLAAGAGVFVVIVYILMRMLGNFASRDNEPRT